MVFHAKRVSECSERERNPSLREGLMELCLKGGLLGVH